MTDHRYVPSHFAVFEVIVDTRCGDSIDALDAAQKMVDTLGNALEDTRMVKIRKVEEFFTLERIE